MIYSMSNAKDCNEIMAFRQEAGGNLTFITAYETDGKGTGAQAADPLMSQGSIVISDDSRFLFVVNAGSNSISSFKITNSGTLILADVKHSGGSFPVSIATQHDLLYVANRGNGSSIASNVTGFWVDDNGKLNEITYSTKPLSSKNSQPTCIVFNYESKKIAVSEVNTNLISVFTIQSNGTLVGPVVSPSSGAGPFGSVFLTNNVLLVTEAGANALSSYTVNHDGMLSVISSSVPNNQAATCWVSLSHNKRFAYTSNAGGHTITTYEIKYNGHLRVSNVIYSTKDVAGAPIDSGICSNHLYVLNGNEGSISDFQTSTEGKLIRTQVFRDTHLPNLGSQGMALLHLHPICKY
jgi:6-phosphogluconolactonase (cycloisomerase 2 family)